MRIQTRSYVWIAYYITFTVMLLATTDNIPFSYEAQRIVKYFYILFILVMNAKVIGFRHRIYFKPLIFLLLLLIHTILFGCFFVNSNVLPETIDNFKNLLIVLSISYLTARYCYWTNSRKEFLTATFFSCVTFLGWCYITHLNGFAPVRYLIKLPQILFSSSDTYGFSFGAGHHNYTGNCAFFALVVAVMLWQYKDEFSGILSKYASIIFALTGILFISILLSSASRGEILSTLIFLVLIICIRKWNSIKNHDLKLILSVLVFIAIILTILGVIRFTFADGSLSNRTLNFTINYEVFKAHGNWLTGMGYIEQHGFYGDVYGYDTWPCDVYYLYVFFTTGIIGVTIMGVALVYLIRHVFFVGDFDYKADAPMKALLVALLFDNLFHCTFLSYIYLMCYPTLILFFECLYHTKRN